MGSINEGLIQEAIKEAKSGNKSAARNILSKIVKQTTNDARAWYLLSQVVEKPDQETYCLEQVLKIQPDNEQAKQRLQKLQSDQKFTTIINKPAIVASEKPPEEKPVIPQQSNKIQTASEKTKKCPFCAETIKEDAIVCRYCGKTLSNSQRVTSSINKDTLVPPKLILSIGLVGIVILLATLISLFILSNMNGQKSIPNYIPTNSFAGMTNKPTNSAFQITPNPPDQNNSCNPALVDIYVQQSSSRTREMKQDMSEFNALAKITNYDVTELSAKAKEYSEQAQKRYYAQQSQQTPDCLSKIQVITVELHRLYWKAMESASKGDFDAAIPYLKQALITSDSLTRALDEFDASH